MERTKQEVKTGQVTLRRIEWADFLLLMAWRSLPHVYETMVECPYPPSEEMVAEWMGSYINDPEKKFGGLDIIEVDSKPVGYVLGRNYLDGVPEVGVVIGDRDYWSVGVAKEAARLGYEILRGLGFRKVQAVTKVGNAEVENFIEDSGFQQIYSDPQIKRWLKEL